MKHVTKCDKTKWKEIIWLFRPLPGAEVPIYLFGRVCYIWSPLSCNFSCPCGLGRLKRHVAPVATVAVMQELLGWQLLFLITIFLVCQLSAHRHNLTYLTFSHLQFNDSIQDRVLLKGDSFSQFLWWSLQKHLKERFQRKEKGNKKIPNTKNIMAYMFNIKYVYPKCQVKHPKHEILH